MDKLAAFVAALGLVFFGYASAATTLPATKSSSSPASMPRPAAQTQTYSVIPVDGQIGLHFTADFLKTCLDQIDRNKPDIIILKINSPGGSVAETEKIIELLTTRTKVRTVAYVERAISAAAIISLSCKEIYVDQRAVIGGAYAYTTNSWNMPAEIGEKMQSIWRASCRSAAELGGHQSIIAESMIDKDIELSLGEKDGRPIVVEGSEPGKAFKRKGKILTMTASEAVACGLAESTTTTWEDFRAKLGVKAWKEDAVAVRLYTIRKKEVDEAVATIERLKKAFDSAISQTINENSNRAAAPLAQAVSILGQVADLAKKYPGLQLDEEKIRDLMRELEGHRARIQRGG